MSEATDKVRGQGELPLFPLPVVLFPGVPLPLHIFEPRYRQMLSDIQLAKNLFGLAYFDPSSGESDVPPAGHIGCVAEVTEVQTFPDGRSNILTLGVIRYRMESYVERGDPYLVAQVSYFEDDEEDEQILAAPSREVAETFTRIAQAVRTINDERATLPDISDTEPQRLSFLVAAAMEIDAEVKQELLELRSTSERLERLRAMLNIAVQGYEERARIHELAKGNGHGGRKIEIE
ncbi:MAG TPA: LON peptidase substrate-binding domain-containing protein [Pyrinomonadaceae bacterium]|jgi:ATP-dependent Lon protease|nr:LON peptidase substrate-binding domain-containing protein [Pyrinomonadaceae bacterium]